MLLIILYSLVYISMFLFLYEMVVFSNKYKEIEQTAKKYVRNYQIVYNGLCYRVLFLGEFAKWFSEGESYLEKFDTKNEAYKYIRDQINGAWGYHLVT